MLRDCQIYSKLLESPCICNVYSFEGVTRGIHRVMQRRDSLYEPDSLPCKIGEVGACKDLEGSVITIGSGNEGKDGDMLHTSKEKLALHWNQL